VSTTSIRRPRTRHTLDPFLPIIHQFLDADRSMPAKQRHTAERIDQRLRDEHGYTGSRTVVRGRWPTGTAAGPRCSCHWPTRRARRRWTVVDPENWTTG